jgi:hypothetical protein
MENGWTHYEAPAEGFGIALPPNWEQFDLDPDVLQASIEALAENNPAWADVLEEQARYLKASGTLKFLAFDFSTGVVDSPYPSYVEVIRQPVIISKLLLSPYVQNLVKNIERVPTAMKPVSWRRITLPAGDAAEIRFGLQFAGPAGEAITLSVVEYLIPTSQELYTISFSAPMDLAERYDALFEEIAETFELLN